MQFVNKFSGKFQVPVLDKYSYILSHLIKGLFIKLTFKHWLSVKIRSKKFPETFGILLH